MRPFIPSLPDPGDPDEALAKLEHRIHAYLDEEKVFGINVKLYLEIVQPLQQKFYSSKGSGGDTSLKSQILPKAKKSSSAILNRRKES